MNKILISIGVVVALIAVIVVAGSSNNQQPGNSNTPNTADSVTLQDAHGLAVDRSDSSKVYVATHTGLLVLRNDKELHRVGNSQDDYMGFSAHPTDANTFYTSGHSKGGGNIGFQKSVDGGKTWRKVSDGVGGPVDFHTLTVSQAQPSSIYGVYHGQIQRSDDEGKNWELVYANIGNIITLSTASTSKDTVYAGTTNGFYVSKNRGKEWAKTNGIKGAVTAIAVSPENAQNIIVYAVGQGLMRSTDDGTTWAILKGYSGDMVMQLAIDRQNPSTIYLVNQTLEIQKTTDTGDSWTKVR